MHAIKEIEKDGYKIKIFRDEFPESPREWDNLGTLVCFHRRYNLGDVSNYNSSDFSGWNEVKEQIEKDHDVAVILPLYLYDHSGQAISHKSWIGRAHHAEWDSGQVGWAYVTKQGIREWYGIKRVTKKYIHKATETLISEIEIYSAYLEGEAYGYQTTKNGDHWDSCSGFFSLEHCEKEALDTIAWASTLK